MCQPTALLTDVREIRELMHLDGNEQGKVLGLKNIVKMQVATAAVAWISAADEDEGQFRTHYLGNVTFKPQQQQNQDVQPYLSPDSSWRRSWCSAGASEFLNRQELRQIFEDKLSAQNTCRIRVGRNSMTSSYGCKSCH